ncbi:CubicO group peptidase, beta-lactamase class C family [Chitinophaga ginsengisegetis]|uniref:CubicO group peptidase, beta-lactamase class C family n=1 Tax=Chitinophaga ginsengisegetis TaxID=393003 RepID=A0A1T5NCJ9_9BACT|nr:serine hydrolase [Chitinophaga ginsengisegetis]SKC98185.1 CubicO group peptidase, beta-lactamase class C family [Chitinophaga ginsengisegetis]
MTVPIINRWISCLCCLTMAAVATAQSPAKNNKLEKIDAALTDILQEAQGAGFAVAVVEKDQVIFSKGFGYRDMTRKLPVTAHTRFAIGSCTKAFTSALLGDLRQEGKVDFDKPATTYLPALDFADSYLNTQVTLRDMMCHRTGFSRYDLAWYLFETDSRDSLLKRMHFMKPNAPLRARWQYNNFMFMVQGMVAERLTGQSWEQNITSRIFQPLGMSESSIGTIALAAADEPSRGYQFSKENGIKEMKYHPIVAMGPAGAINSTVMDMSKWLITWIYGGKYHGKEIIPADYVKEAISSQMVIPGGEPDKQTPYIQFANYGLGWMLLSYRGHYRVEHGGNIDGFTALTTFYPTDSIGIVVLSNQNNSAIPTKVTNLITDRLLGIVADTKSKNKPGKKEDDPAPSRDSAFKPHAATHPVTAFAGVFKNDAYGNFEISVKKDSLFATFPDVTWYLNQEDYNIFSPYDAADSVIDVKYKSNVRVQFLMNNSGEIDRLSFAYDPSGDPVIFDRVPQQVVLSAASLAPFVGAYKLASVPIQIKLSDTQVLTMVVPGQPVYTLEAIDNSTFRIKGLKEFKVKFIRDDKDKVVALTSIQPNGTFRAEKE